MAAPTPIPSLELPELSPRARRAGLLLAFCGGLIYLALSLALEPQAMLDSLGRLGLGGIALVLSLSLLNYGLRFFRWHWYLRRLGQRLPLGRHALIYFGGFALTVSPGKAGEALRALYLRPMGVPYARSFAVLLVERVLDLMAMALLASLLLLHVPGLGGGVAVAALIAIAIALMAGTPLPQRLCARVAQRETLPHRARAVAASVGNLLQASAAILRPRRLLPGLVVGVLSWGAEGWGLYLLVHSMGLDLTPQQAIGVFAMAALAGAALVFMPGGLGGAEAALTALLLALGAPLATALAATLLCRMATLWFAVALGMIAVAVLEWRGDPLSDSPSSPP